MKVKRQQWVKRQRENMAIKKREDINREIENTSKARMKLTKHIKVNLKTRERNLSWKKRVWFTKGIESVGFGGGGGWRGDASRLTEETYLQNLNYERRINMKKLPLFLYPSLYPPVERTFRKCLAKFSCGVIGYPYHTHMIRFWRIYQAFTFN